MSTTNESDRCSSTEAAALLHMKPGAFHNLRRRLQMVYDRTEQRVRDYPSEDTINALYRQAGSPEQRPSRIDLAASWYQSTHWLVLPEWGGSKPPHSSWTFSRTLLTRFRDEGPGALGPHLAAVSSE